jgi:hypothetical protein
LCFTGNRKEIKFDNINFIKNLQYEKIQFILILFYIFGSKYNEKTKLKLNNQNFYVELNSNFIKYNFSETELDSLKNRINIPSNFLL